MRLGIMVTTDRHLAQVEGLVRAALGRGHRVAIFVTDEGVRLLAERRFRELGALRGVTLTYCKLSAEQRGGAPAGLPGSIVAGSQFENAVMVAESDRVLML